MKETFRVVQVDFDELENRNPVYEKRLATFRTLAAMDKWFKKQPSMAHYVGYDGQVYPQFRVDRETVL